MNLEESLQLSDEKVQYPPHLGFWSFMVQKTVLRTVLFPDDGANHGFGGGTGASRFPNYLQCSMVMSHFHAYG